MATLVFIQKHIFFWGDDFHGAYGTSGDAELAYAAFFLVEKNRHFRAADLQGSCGADGGACSAVGALFFIPFDLLGGSFNAQSLLFKKLDTIIEVFFGSGQLHNQKTFFPGIDGGTENGEGQVKLFGQVADHGAFNFCLGKSENQYLGMQDFPPVIAFLNLGLNLQSQRPRKPLEKPLDLDAIALNGLEFPMQNGNDPGAAKKMIFYL